MPSPGQLRSHLQPPQVGAEGEPVGPEGGELTSLVTELAVRAFLSRGAALLDGKERGEREEQEEQCLAQHDELGTTDKICRSVAATEQGPVSQDRDHRHDH